MMSVLIDIIVTLFITVKSILSSWFYCIFPSPRKSIQNEKVLITGAGSGIGREMCIEFSKKGAEIIACDINPTTNEETAQMIKQTGGKIHTYTCDVSQKHEVYKLADKVQREVGHVDILVNNAGIFTEMAGILDKADSMIQKTMEVNLLAHFWTIKSFLPAMKARNHGHIVTISSIAGYLGAKYIADYTASKFGTVGMTESLLYELRADGLTGIHTTTVCPYSIDTNMYRGLMRRDKGAFPILQPEYVVKKIMDAVLTNQTVLIIPTSFHILHWLRSFLPMEAVVAIINLFTLKDEKSAD